MKDSKAGLSPRVILVEFRDFAILRSGDAREEKREGEAQRSCSEDKMGDTGGEDTTVCG